GCYTKPQICDLIVLLSRRRLGGSQTFTTISDTVRLTSVRFLHLKIQVGDNTNLGNLLDNMNGGSMIITRTKKTKPLASF
ncbi:MAG: hypothetical protein ACI9NN_002325, partial [Bacteroidia bacterium]